MTTRLAKLLCIGILLAWLTGCGEKPSTPAKRSSPSSTDNSKSPDQEAIPADRFRLSVEDLGHGPTKIAKRITIEGSPDNVMSIGVGQPELSSALRPAALDQQSVVVIVSGELKTDSDSNETSVSVVFEKKEVKQPSEVFFQKSFERAFPVESGMQLSDLFSIDVKSGVYKLGPTIVIGRVLTHDITLTLSPGKERQEPTAESLKSIAKAFYEYNEHFGHFPPAASTDASGKPLLSWRVHILPFVDAYDLYEQFHLDEPWNSDHNQKLIDQMPAIYRMTDADEKAKTSLMVFTGDHSVFGGAKAESRKGPLKQFRKPAATDIRQVIEETREDVQIDPITGHPVVHQPPPNQSPPKMGPTIGDITDGTSNTILAVCAGSDKSIPWTKPEDLPFQPENPVSALGQIPDDGFVALFWDSRVERLPKNIESARLNSFIDSTEFARKGVRQEGEDPPLN